MKSAAASYSRNLSVCNFITNKNKKGQMKIQQMAFVLVAIFIFFAIAALFYLSINLADVKNQAALTKQEGIKEEVLKIARTAEFAWKSGESEREDCPNCVDFDKLLAVKDVKGYDKLWQLDYLAVRIIYPAMNTTECTKTNYPNCNQITLSGANRANIGTTNDAFVAVCRWQSSEAGGYRKCSIGKIYAAGVLV